MLKNTLIVLCLLHSLITFAQNNEQLFLDNTWYLSKIEVNQEYYFPPFESSTEFASFQNVQLNGNLIFIHNQCSNTAMATYSFVNETSFLFSEFAVTAVLCPNLNLESYFGTLNFQVFETNIQSNFEYSITSENESLQLVITGANGNKAYYYNNQTAKTKYFSSELIKIYPNPSSDFINISISDLDEIEVFDVIGKQMEVKRNTNVSQTQIDIQHLPKGNYILKISKDKQTENFSFIKK